MRKLTVIFIMVIAITSICYSKAATKDPGEYTTLRGKYLGQKPPGMIPEMFAPGIVSTKEKSEINSVFSPDGNEFYFSRKDLRKDAEGKEKEIWTIKCMKRVNNRWTKPKTAPFSGIYKDADMSISHDGYRFFFCSNRPFPGGSTPKENLFIWMMVRTKTGWSEPQFLDNPVNAGKYALHPTLTYNGTMYFQSSREENIGKWDVYRSRFVNGSYIITENLGRIINSKYGDGDACIAADDSYIIVSCEGRPENIGIQDLYIGFRKSDGAWTTLKNMGKPINTEHREGSPMLSPDKKYLFFTSARAGNGDIYWVDAKVIEQLKSGTGLYKRHK